MKLYCNLINILTGKRLLQHTAEHEKIIPAGTWRRKAESRPKTGKALYFTDESRKEPPRAKYKAIQGNHYHRRKASRNASREVYHGRKHNRITGKICKPAEPWRAKTDLPRAKPNPNAGRHYPTTGRKPATQEGKTRQNRPAAKEENPVKRQRFFQNLLKNPHETAKNWLLKSERFSTYPEFSGNLPKKSATQGDKKCVAGKIETKIQKMKGEQIMKTYEECKKELQSRRSNIRGFNETFYNTFKMDYYTIQNALDYAEKCGEKVSCTELWMKSATHKTWFYNHNSGAYCEFLSIF